jgi:hypothetical protein
MREKGGQSGPIDHMVRTRIARSVMIDSIEFF